MEGQPPFSSPLCGLTCLMQAGKAMAIPLKIAGKHPKASFRPACKSQATCLPCLAGRQAAKYRQGQALRRSSDVEYRSPWIEEAHAAIQKYFFSDDFKLFHITRFAYS